MRLRRPLQVRDPTPRIEVGDIVQNISGTKSYTVSSAGMRYLVVICDDGSQAMVNAKDVILKKKGVRNEQKSVQSNN